VAEIVAFVREQSEVVAPEACRDPHDLPVLGTASAGRADLLVTGDSDLLCIARFETVEIVAPRACYERLLLEPDA
jgi:predicted nucleic acid-binding protein